MVSSNSLSAYVLSPWFCLLTSEYASFRIQGHILHFLALPMGSKEEGRTENHQNIRNVQTTLQCYILER